MKLPRINEFANWVTIVTGIIALCNFGYSISQGVYGEVISVPDVPLITLPFRIIIFIILETALAYAFGYMLIKIEAYGHGVPAVTLWLVSLISAWTSLFNVQWLISGAVPLNNQFFSLYTLWFFVLSGLASFIAVYFISTHSNEYKKWTRAKDAQLVSFIVMFFMYLYGK